MAIGWMRCLATALWQLCYRFVSWRSSDRTQLFNISHRKTRFKGVITQSLYAHCLSTFWDWLADVNHNAIAHLLSAIS